MSQIRAGSDPSTTKEGAAASTSSSSSSASSADGQALQNAEGENTAAAAAAAAATTTAPSSSRSRAKRKAPATDGDTDGTKKRTYARTDYRKDPVHRARLDSQLLELALVEGGCRDPELDLRQDRPRGEVENLSIVLLTPS